MTVARLLQEILAVAIGGSLGSVLRFLLSRWVQGIAESDYFPWGILTVNLVGCLVIGILFGVLVERFPVGPLTRTGIFIGVLGGFTTFSSFTLDTITLIYSGAYGIATLYVLASVGVGVFATGVGLSVVRLILR